MRIRWRTGFDINPKLAGLAPIAAIVIGAVGEFGTTALWVGAPVVPLAMVYGGLAEGTAETVGMSTLMGVFVGAWIVLGVALLRTDEARPAAQHVNTPESLHTTAHMRASRSVNDAGHA